VRSIDVIQGDKVISPRPLFGYKPKPATAKLTDATRKASQ
jgi:hypothetical protein